MKYGNFVIEECSDVYAPREDSLLLTDAVDRYATGKILDLGTGSGIQGIVAAKKGSEVTFADIKSSALNCARENAKANGVTGEFVKSDMFSGIRKRKKFDTIVFNPPYLPSDGLSRPEPRDYRLDGGASGREMINLFLAEYKKFLNPSGIALLVESSLNNYERDVKEHKAKVVAKTHFFFEDIVVLLLR